MTMQARRMTGHEAEESRPDGAAADERRMLAIGKRVDHRWVVEMSLRRGHRMLSPGGKEHAAHAT